MHCGERLRLTNGRMGMGERANEPLVVLNGEPSPAPNGTHQRHCVSLPHARGMRPADARAEGRAGAPMARPRDAL